MKIYASRQHDDQAFLESLVGQDLWVLVSWEPADSTENLFGFQNKLYIKIGYSGNTKYGCYYFNAHFTRDKIGQVPPTPPYKLFNKSELHVVYPKELYTEQEFFAVA